jgi:hypothetical protein
MFNETIAEKPTRPFLCQKFQKKHCFGRILVGFWFENDPVHHAGGTPRAAWYGTAPESKQKDHAALGFSVH